MAITARRYGPYTSTSGHLFFWDIFEDGSRKVVLVHRELMEQHLGRKLSKTEVVHHINENKTDNRIENLQVLSHRQHIRHHHPQAALARFACPICGAVFAATLRQVRKSQFKDGRSGPYCSKPCAGRGAYLRRGVGMVNKGNLKFPVAKAACGFESRPRHNDDRLMTERRLYGVPDADFSGNPIKTAALSDGLKILARWRSGAAHPRTQP